MTDMQFDIIASAERILAEQEKTRQKLARIREAREAVLEVAQDASAAGELTDVEALARILHAQTWHYAQDMTEDDGSPIWRRLIPKAEEILKGGFHR